MSDTTMGTETAGSPSPRPHLDEKAHVTGAIAFLGVLLAGSCFGAYSIVSDVSAAGEHDLAIGAFVLLWIALLIALGLSS